MNKSKVGFILFMALCLVGCNTDKESSSSSLNSSSVGGSSDVSSSIEDSTSSELSSTGGISSTGSSETSDSSSSTTVGDLTAETIKQLIATCIETPNYTLTLNDMDGIRVGKYTPNAYYCETPNDGNIGYAKNASGIFTFEYGGEEIVPTSKYLKDADEALFTDLYSEKVIYDNFDRDYFYINSFSLLDIADFADLADNFTTNGYVVEKEAVVELLPYLSQDAYSMAAIKVSLTEENNLEFKFSVSSGFGTPNIYTLTVSEIETTTIDSIEEYLASGKGEMEEKNLLSQVKELLGCQNYVYTAEDGSAAGIITEKYNFIYKAEGEAIGYVDVPENPFEIEIGIHSYSYISNNEEGLVISPEVETEVESLAETYGFSGKFLDLFVLDSSGEKLVTNNPAQVKQFSSRFGLTVINVGYVEITLENAAEGPTLTITGYVNAYQPTGSDETITIYVSKIGQVTADLLYEDPCLGQLESLTNPNA